MELNEVQYIDTSNYKFKSTEKGVIRRLKDLVSEQLNASIQTSTHSSEVDARAAMAFFEQF